MNNFSRLVRLVGNNCNVIDISTCDEEKDKIFSVVRKFKNYDFDINFEVLINAGFIPKYMHIWNNKDEIVFEVK